MKRTWKKVLAFVCAFTLVAVPITYNIVNADGSDSDSIARFLGASDASSSSVAAENAAAEDASTGTEYMLTIPSTLTVKNSGWNEIEGGIAATGTLEAGKKLVVTAESENSWALKSGDNSVGYNLAANGNSESVYNKESNPASWEFESLSADAAATKKAGVIVEDYSEKPAGNYEDVVTFTASLADVPVTGVSLNKTTATFEIGESVDLTATVTPDNAANKTVTWKSSAETVATVDGNGKVTGVSEGTATITATVGDKSTECSVTVEAVAPAAAKGIFWQTGKKLDFGEGAYLKCDWSSRTRTVKMTGKHALHFIYYAGGHIYGYVDGFDGDYNLENDGGSGTIYGIRLKGSGTEADPYVGVPVHTETEHGTFEETPVVSNEVYIEIKINGYGDNAHTKLYFTASGDEFIYKKGSFFADNGAELTKEGDKLKLTVNADESDTYYVTVDPAAKTYSVTGKTPYNGGITIVKWTANDVDISSEWTQK